MLPVAALAIAALAQSPDRSGTAVGHADGRLLVAMATADLAPGVTFGIHVADLRVDPRTGEIVSGLRYAGDGRVVWVGPDLVEIALTAGAQPVRLHEPVLLAAPLGLAPTPAWTPPPPEPTAVETPAAMVVAPPTAGETPAATGVAAPTAGETPAAAGIAAATGIAPATEAPPRPSRTPPPRFDVAEAHWGGRRQSLVAWGGFAGTGYETDARGGGLSWRWHPDAGLGRVEVGLEGLRASRWVKGSSEDEPYGREIAAGYWLWTRLDGASDDLAAFGGVGLGVDVEGLAVATLLGLRTGDPAGSYVALAWDQRGRLGQRFVLDGRAALADGARIGVRSRLGDLPRNDPGVRRWHTDGAVVGSLDLSRALTVDLAAGLGGYDLTWADAAPVLDATVEVRF